MSAILRALLLGVATLAVFLNASPIQREKVTDEVKTKLDADLLRVYMDYLESFGFHHNHEEEKKKNVVLKRYQKMSLVADDDDGDEDDVLRPYNEDPDEEQHSSGEQEEEETPEVDESPVRKIFRGQMAANDDEGENDDESYSLFEINFKIDNMTRYIDIFKQIKAKADLEVNEIDIFNYLTRPSEFYQMHTDELNETVYYEIFYNQSFEKLIDYMKYYVLNEQTMLNQTKSYMENLNYTIVNYANLTNATDQNGFPVLRNSREELVGLYQFIRTYYDDKLVELNLARDALEKFEIDGDKEAYYFTYLDRIVRFRKRLNTFLEIVRFLLFETRSTLDKIELSLSKESRGLDMARSQLTRSEFHFISSLHFNF